VMKCLNKYFIILGSFFRFFSYVFVCAEKNILWCEMTCHVKDVAVAVEGVAVDSLLQL
jgi:hypothetical protein